MQFIFENLAIAEFYKNLHAIVSWLYRDVELFPAKK